MGGRPHVKNPPSPCPQNVHTEQTHTLTTDVFYGRSL